MNTESNITTTETPPDIWRRDYREGEYMWRLKLGESIILPFADVVARSVDSEIVAETIRAGGIVVENSLEFTGEGDNREIVMKEGDILIQTRDMYNYLVYLSLNKEYVHGKVCTARRAAEAIEIILSDLCDKNFQVLGEGAVYNDSEQELGDND